MAKRTRVSVRWSKDAGEWVVFTGDREFEWHDPTKALAVARAREIAKTDAPSELVIYTKKGRIQETRSYGTDPRRTRG